MRHGQRLECSAVQTHQESSRNGFAACLQEVPPGLAPALFHRRTSRKSSSEMWANQRSLSREGRQHSEVVIGQKSFITFRCAIPPSPIGTAAVRTSPVELPFLKCLQERKKKPVALLRAAKPVERLNEKLHVASGRPAIFVILESVGPILFLRPAPFNSHRVVVLFSNRDQVAGQSHVKSVVAYNFYFRQKSVHDSITQVIGHETKTDRHAVDERKVIIVKDSLLVLPARQHSGGRIVERRCKHGAQFFRALYI